MPAVRRTFALLLVALAVLAGVATASPAQAASTPPGARSTWCTDWRQTGVVAGVGRTAERACVQSVTSGYFRTVVEVTVTSQQYRLRRAASPSATPSASPSARPTRDGLLLSNVYSLPSHGSSVKRCRIPAAQYSGLDRGESVKLDCYTDYVTVDRGVARARVGAKFTIGGVTKDLPMSGWISRAF